MSRYSTCRICGHNAVPNADRLCGLCRKAGERCPERYDPVVELTGGRWVNDRGVMRWEADK